jgi:phage terminase small subunit
MHRGRFRHGPILEANLKKRLTHKELALVRNLTKGLSLTKSALAAGYSDKHPGQSGWQALESIRHKIPEVLDKHSLTDSALIEKHLLPALEAHETKFVQKDGKITDQMNVIAWGARLTALDLAFRLKGSYAPRKPDR